MPDEPANTATLEEQLVAYLDGELEPDQSRRVEELLASDAEVRAALQRLDRTWELLDQLDRQETEEETVCSTMELVAAVAEEDVTRLRSAASARRRFALAAGGLLAASLAGFLIVWGLTPDANQALLEDLPVLENLEAYQEIDDLEFLRELSREQLFADFDDTEALSDEG
jgi:anti-sigma factor RsiW